jgi:hypothetical protein
MPDTEEHPESDFEDLEQTSSVNFRDYPSSALVVFAALSSGLGWMLFKWMGRKRKAQRTASDETEETESVPQSTKPSGGDV